MDVLTSAVSQAQTINPERTLNDTISRRSLFRLALPKVRETSAVREAWRTATRRHRNTAAARSVLSLPALDAPTLVNPYDSHSQRVPKTSIKVTQSCYRNVRF